MLAQILSPIRLSRGLFLLGAIALFAGCATKPKAQFVNDPDAKHESTIPWNKQEKWESQGPYAGLTDRR